MTRFVRALFASIRRRRRARPYDWQAELPELRQPGHVRLVHDRNPHHV